MKDSDTLAGVDLELAWLLRRQPRASFAELGRLAGVSERTAARRVERLQTDGVIRSIATLLSDRLYDALVAQLEIVCVPSKAHTVAAALADRDDTRFVVQTAGTRDVTAEVLAPDQATLRQVLTDEIAHINGVVSVRTSLTIRLLLTANDWDPTSDTPSTWRARAMRGEKPPPPIAIDDVDHAIATMLRSDARAPITRLAHRLDIAEATVHRRLTRLVESEALLLRTEIAPAALGYPTEARFTLNIQPRHLDEALRTLAADASLRSLYVTTGPYNILGYTSHRTVDQLYDLLSSTFGQLPGVASTDVSVILAAPKRTWTRLPTANDTRRRASP